MNEDNTIAEPDNKTLLEALTELERFQEEEKSARKIYDESRANRIASAIALNNLLKNVRTGKNNNYGPIIVSREDGTMVEMETNIHQGSSDHLLPYIRQLKIARGAKPKVENE